MNNSRRLEFHEILVDILGSRDVYFQPPSNIKMKFPCILYARKAINTKYADNHPYNSTVCYVVTLVDTNADSVFLCKLNDLKTSKFINHYTSDNLNHDVFEIYY